MASDKGNLCKYHLFEENEVHYLNYGSFQVSWNSGIVRIPSYLYRIVNHFAWLTFIALPGNVGLHHKITQFFTLA